MFSLNPSEKKVLLIIAVVIFLGTLIRYFNLEVEESGLGLVSKEEQLSTININQASAISLQKLPGIGPVLSQRILEYREKNEPFEKLTDLKKVKGIGQHKAEALREYIEF